MKRIFKQDTTVGWRALLFIVIAVALMIVDDQNHYFHQFREKAEIIITPVEYTVSFPLDLTETVVNELETQQALIKENVKLKAKVLMLRAKVQKMLAVQNENKQLKQLLQSSVRADGEVSQAQILAVSPDPALHEVVINKGEQQNVYVGQPVLDAYGVMGQVMEVGVLTSRVLLLTDSKSAIPVQDSRSGVRAIAVGDSQMNKLRLEHVTQTEDIKQGDLLIASGLGQRYPYGYPVGTVTQVKTTSGNQFRQIIVSPAAHLNRSRLVLLVWPGQGNQENAQHIKNKQEAT